MYRTQVIAVQISEHVNRVSDHIQKTSLDLVTCRHGYRTVKIHNLDTTAHAISTLHGDTSYDVFTDMLLNLENKFLAIVALHLQGGINRRNVFFSTLERDVYHRSDNLGHCAVICAHIIFLLIIRTIDKIRLVD